MKSTKLFRIAIGVALVGMIVAGAAFWARQTFFKPKTITAYFTSVTAIYPGDDVRVAGVKVGTIGSIQPQGAQVKMTMHVDRDVPIPAAAKAVIVAQNLVSARYVQLAPAYESDGPTMPDGAVIPVERTAIPVEWNEVKDQLNRLADALGPHGNVSDTPVSRFIDSTADALAGNGTKLRQTLTQLAGVGRILANGSGNLVDIIKNLQNFITTLRQSNEHIVQFEGRLATLSSVLDGSRSDLDAALKNVSDVVGDVQRFVHDTRDKTAEQIQRLAAVSQILVEHSKSLEQILHIAPTSLSNTYNFGDRRDGGPNGSFVFNNFSNPVELICSAIGAVENATAAESAKFCQQYLGPALRLLTLNLLPLPVNPLLAPVYNEELVYSEPCLEPGAPPCPAGPPEIPPAVSAYTGLRGDTPGDDAAATVPGAVPASALPTVNMPVMEPIPGPVPMDTPDVLLPAERSPR